MSIRAARDLCMSTEHQPHSLKNQSAAIKRYAILMVFQSMQISNCFVIEDTFPISAFGVPILGTE